MKRLAAVAALALAITAGVTACDPQPTCGGPNQKPCLPRYK